MQTINFKNLNHGQEEFIHHRLGDLFRNFNMKTSMFFERSSKGHYRGRILAQTRWGESYVDLQRRDLESLCFVLKKKIKNQVCKKIASNGRAKKEVPFEIPGLNFEWDSIAIAPLVSEGLNLSNQPCHEKTALIIDDDIESLLPINELFNSLGCKTLYAIGEKDASAKIKNTKVDIIILDWQLGKITGGDIIRQCTEDIRRGQEVGLIQNFQAPKVVTYSGLSHKEVRLSKDTSSFFEHVDHWKKPIRFNEMRQRAQGLFASVGLV